MASNLESEDAVVTASKDSRAHLESEPPSSTSTVDEVAGTVVRSHNETDLPPPSSEAPPGGKPESEAGAQSEPPRAATTAPSPLHVSCGMPDHVVTQLRELSLDGNPDGSKYILLGTRDEAKGAVRVTGIWPDQEKPPAGATIVGSFTITSPDAESKPLMFDESGTSVWVDAKLDVTGDVMCSIRPSASRDDTADMAPVDHHVLFSRLRAFDAFTDDTTLASVRIWRSVWRDLSAWTLQTRGREVAGFLGGTILLRGETRVANVREAWLASEGGSQSVQLTRRSFETAAEHFTKKGFSPVGWWHTHPTQGILLSGADRAKHFELFPREVEGGHPSWDTCVAIVLSPHQKAESVRAGAFLPRPDTRNPVIGDTILRSKVGDAQVEDDWAVTMVNPPGARPTGRSFLLDPVLPDYPQQVAPSGGKRWAVAIPPGRNPCGFDSDRPVVAGGAWLGRVFGLRRTARLPDISKPQEAAFYFQRKNGTTAVPCPSSSFDPAGYWTTSVKADIQWCLKAIVPVPALARPNTGSVCRDLSEVAATNELYDALVDWGDEFWDKWKLCPQKGTPGCKTAKLTRLSPADVAQQSANNSRRQFIVVRCRD